jgi:lysine 6-dehydrogenase
VSGEDFRVAVLGAGGIIARAIVRDLAESEEVSSLLLLDLDGERASRVAAEQAGACAGAVRAVAIDARDGAALAAALAGCRVLVNAASYRLNLVAMEAALEAGCDYLDLGGLYWMTARQLELHDRFARAGRLAVLGIGSSPGKTNVMAARGVRELGGDAVASIHVAAAGRDPEVTSRLRAPYALRTLLDELTMAPVVLDEGVPRELEPLAPGGIVRFPDPIGDVTTIHTLHSELRTFGSSFGVRQASFRLSLAPDVADGRVGARRGDRLDRRPRGGARAAARARPDPPGRRPPARALRRPRRHVPRA